MPAPIDPALRATIEQAIRDANLSRNAIARQHGVSPATVTNVARAAGIDTAFDRANTKRATASRTADLAERRSVLSERALDLAAHMLVRARAPYVYYVATKDDVVPVHLAEPPLNEVRQAATAFGILCDKHAVLERYDSDTQGLAAVDAWLRNLTGQ